MVQPNQQITANTAGEKLIRKTGGNFQPEQERTKSRTVAGGSPKGYNRKSERNKQFHVSRKEQQVSKSSKKAGLLKIPKGKNQNQQLYNESLQSLLNFHYSSPNTTHHYGYGGVKRKRTSTFNKEAFLQANCHFVVQDDASNYAVHATNPDVLVDWNNIQLVYLSTHDAPTCPICLYPPVCGKITRCGHVFCWSCIIHYLHLVSSFLLVLFCLDDISRAERINIACQNYFQLFNNFVMDVKACCLCIVVALSCNIISM